MGEARRIPRIVTIALEALPPPIEAGETAAVGSDPQVAGAVFQEGAHRAGAPWRSWRIVQTETYEFESEEMIEGLETWAANR